MYMLDTDICSYIIRERPLSVLDKFKKMDNSELCISVITKAELMYGVAKSSSKKNNLEIVGEFLSRMVALDWDGAAAEAYGKLRASMESHGAIIGNMDMMIAAHALSIGASVVTNNTRHFGQVPKLKTVNWA